MKAKTLTIMGMTRKGLSVIRAIQANFPELLELVVAARDRNIQDDCFDEIAKFCRSNSIRFASRDESVEVNSDYIMAISWKWIIADAHSRLIVFHDSILPRYRGFNPLVTALINGDTRIGVSAIFGSDEYDRGDIIGIEEADIEYPITIAEAINAIIPCYESLALKVAKKIQMGLPITGRSQSNYGASYSLWRDEEDYLIDWSESSTNIRRFVDAVGYPYKGASSIVDGKIVRVLKVQEVPDVLIENRTPGKVIFIENHKPVVVCGVGLLRIDEMIDEAGIPILRLPRFRLRFVGKGSV